MEQFTLAEKYISDLKSLDRNTALLCNLILLRKKGGLADAEILIAESPCNFCQWWLEVGQVYWDLGDYTKSLEPFLKVRYLNVLWSEWVLSEFYRRQNVIQIVMHRLFIWDITTVKQINWIRPGVVLKKPSNWIAIHQRQVVSWARFIEN